MADVLRVAAYVLRVAADISRVAAVIAHVLADRAVEKAKVAGPRKFVSLF